jgi:hypothetical protein
MGTPSKTNEFTIRIATRLTNELPYARKSAVERYKGGEPPTADLRHHSEGLSNIPRVVSTNLNINPQRSMRIDKNYSPT